MRKYYSALTIRSKLSIMICSVKVYIEVRVNSVMICECARVKSVYYHLVM